MDAAELTRKGSVAEVLILRWSSLMIWTREMLRFLARRTIAPHWLEERWSARHSASPRAVRRAAAARKKGTNTMELVGPIWRGDGRHDLRLWVAGAREGGHSRGRRGKSAEDHWTTKGPDCDGIDIREPPVVGLEGMIVARSAKIWECS